MKITVFKSGALIGDFIDDTDAIASVSCDDRYVKKFIHDMNEKKLLDLEQRSKKWKHFTYIEFTQKLRSPQ